MSFTKKITPYRGMSMMLRVVMMGAMMLLVIVMKAAIGDAVGGWRARMRIGRRIRVVKLSV